MLAVDKSFIKWGRLKVREWKMRHGQNNEGGNCRSGNWESRVQGWKMQEWKMREQIARVENGGVSRMESQTDNIFSVTTILTAIRF